MTDHLTAPGRSPLWTAASLAAFTARLSAGEDRESAAANALLDAAAYINACEAWHTEVKAAEIVAEGSKADTGAAAVTAERVYLDAWVSALPLEVDRVEGGRVYFKHNPDHGPDPVDWPLEEVIDGSRFVPASGAALVTP